jgi:hypothetical protein
LDVGKTKRRIVRHVQPDGSVNTERLPLVPFMRVVDLDGNVVDVPLHNGGANAGVKEPYRLYIMDRKKSRGMVPVNRCPLTQGSDVRRWLPSSILERQPCRTTTDGKPPHPDRETFPLGSWCRCVDDLIAQRRAVHAKVEGSRKTAAETLREIQAKVAQDQLVSTQETNARLVDLLERVAPALAGNDNARAQATNDNKARPKEPR